MFNDACLAKDAYLAIEEFGKWYEKQPFFEKLKTNKYFSELKMQTSAHAVTHDGYVACKEMFVMLWDIQIRASLSKIWTRTRK